jgi:AraC-like DNA-binding protein
MRELPTMSSLPLRLLASGAHTHGFDIDAVLRDVGIDPVVLGDYDARVPADKGMAAWVEAARRSGDPLFGLHIGDESPLYVFDVIDYAVAASPTLGEGLERVRRYMRLITDVGEVSIATEGDVARVTRQLPQHPASMHMGDSFLSFVVGRGRVNTGVDWVPREVRFQHAAPADIGDYERFFRSPLRFERREYEVELDRALLALPMKGADSGLAKLLDRYAGEILARTPVGDRFVDSLRRCVTESLKHADPSLRTVAHKLHVSPRTLQRRLHLEGTSFNVVLDGVRREMAERYLEEQKLSITEIAFLLGFHDVSSFHRAFKRWSSQTPSEFRRRIASR